MTDMDELDVGLPGMARALPSLDVQDGRVKAGHRGGQHGESFPCPATLFPSLQVATSLTPLDVLIADPLCMLYQLCKLALYSMFKGHQMLCSTLYSLCGPVLDVHADILITIAKVSEFLSLCASVSYTFLIQGCQPDDDAEADACTTKNSDWTLKHGPDVGNNPRNDEKETSKGEGRANTVAPIQQAY